MGAADIPVAVAATAGRLEQRGIPVLLVRYEDLDGDYIATLTAIGRHQGLDAPAHLVAAAIDAASFPRLKAQEAAEGFVERPAGATAPFFRSGRPGKGDAALSRGNAEITPALMELLTPQAD